jgi:hypothetical protein
VAKDPRVNRYRSGTHNSNQEVIVFNGEGGIVIHVVDWRSMRVQSTGVARRPARAVDPEFAAAQAVTVAASALAEAT